MFHGTATRQSSKPLAHEAFVVVLAEEESVRIGGGAGPASPRGTCAMWSPRSQKLAPVPSLAERERSLDDAELRVDLQGARLHAERSRLNRRAGIPVYDVYAHISPNQLIGDHEPGRASPDDQNVSIHLSPSPDELNPKTQCLSANRLEK